MPKSGYTHLTFLLDRSGSMRTTADDAIGGFNQLLANQQTVPGECTVSLIQFDHEYRQDHHMVPIGKVEPLTAQTFVPRGSTAYVDALARSITELGESLNALNEEDRPETVIFAVITDGMENASKIYRGAVGRAQVGAMIKTQREVYKWQFAFMGSDEDALEHAEEMQIPCSGTLSYDDRYGTRIAYASLDAGIERARGLSGASGQSMGMTFTAEDRQSQTKLKSEKKKEEK